MNVIGIKYFWQPLTLLFIGLKLTDYIDWSWWLVLLPIYFKVALAIGIALLVIPFGKKGLARLDRIHDFILDFQIKPEVKRELHKQKLLEEAWKKSQAAL